MSKARLLSPLCFASQLDWHRIFFQDTCLVKKVFSLKQTPLHTLHQELGARLVPFAGYEMPLHYREGILKEHLYTRSDVSLFDVSHMGQIEISGPHAREELEKLLPLDLDTLFLSQQAYTVLPNAAGGVIDDLVVTRRNRDNFLLVVNAGSKERVIEHLSSHLQTSPIHILNQQALLALQGPGAARVIDKVFNVDSDMLVFMHGMLAKFRQAECFICRSGYTGEDGFEISIAASDVETLARALLSIKGVKPAGLGARDSLRLEAGLCLYGHELTETRSPIEAGLGWTISPTRRKQADKAGGFIGGDTILLQLEQGTQRKRVGLSVQGRIPVREGAVLRDAQQREAGIVTSGTYSPSLDSPIAMAYVDAACAARGNRLTTEIRGKTVTLEITSLPFVPHRYRRK